MSASTYCKAVAVCLRVNEWAWVWFGSCVGGLGACGSLAPLAPGDVPKELWKQGFSLMRNTTCCIGPGTALPPPPPPRRGLGACVGRGVGLAFAGGFVFWFVFWF